LFWFLQMNLEHIVLITISHHCHQYHLHLTLAVTVLVSGIKYPSNSHKDVFSWFRASKSTKKVSEVLKKQLTLDKLEEWESDPTWNNLLGAATHRQVDDDEMQIKLEIAQHFVDELDFNFVKIPVLNRFSDHIHLLGNLSNASCEFPERVMMDLKQAYCQWKRH